MSESEEKTFSQHPALKNFNRTQFMTQYVVKNTMKWGAIAAGAGLAASAGAAVVGLASGGIWTWVGVAMTQAPVIGWLVSSMASGLGSAALAIGIGVVTTAAVAGLAIGGAVSAGKASDAANAEEDRLVAKYEQQEARRDRMAALERRRDEQRFAMEKQGYAMTQPGHHIPKGRQVDMAGPAMAS